MTGPREPRSAAAAPGAGADGAARVHEITVPGSSANVGPGFDAVGIAVGVRDTVVVSALPPGEIAVEVTGAGAGSVPLDGTHLVARAVRSTLDALGAAPTGFALTCANALPHARGLGSSAAAAVAGVAAGYALAGVELDAGERAGRALRLAAAFEGHADNAAPSLLGGVCVAWESSSGFRAARLDAHPDVALTLFVPAAESSTAQTRGLLPAAVPLADAAFNAGRAALLTHALTTDPTALLDATADRLHQPYRRGAYPATAALVDALRAGGVAAAVSGAGPTVMALTCGYLDLDAMTGVDVTGFEVWRPAIDQDGARVTSP